MDISKKEKETLRSFERKIVQRVCGLVKLDNGKICFYEIPLIFRIAK